MLGGPSLVNIGWTDVPGAALGVLIALAVLALVIALLAFGARRRKSPSVVLDVTGALARMWVALVGVLAVFAVIQWATASWTQVAELPVAAPWPTPLPCDDRGASGGDAGAVLDCAHFSSASATITGLDGGVRALLGVADVLTLLVVAAPGVVLAVLCQSALSGRPFAPRTVRWLFIGAGVVLVAGCGGAILGDVGAAAAAREVLLPAGVPLESGEATATAPVAVRLALPAWPIGLALGMAALGVVFRRGAQLQRDSEGLV